jgi:hypothetical protein
VIELILTEGVRIVCTKYQDINRLSPKAQSKRVIEDMLYDHFLQTETILCEFDKKMDSLKSRRQFDSPGI